MKQKVITVWSTRSFFPSTMEYGSHIQAFDCEELAEYLANGWEVQSIHPIGITSNNNSDRVLLTISAVSQVVLVRREQPAPQVEDVGQVVPQVEDVGQIVLSALVDVCDDLVEKFDSDHLRAAVYERLGNAGVTPPDDVVDAVVNRLQWRQGRIVFDGVLGVGDDEE